MIKKFAASYIKFNHHFSKLIVWALLQLVSENLLAASPLASDLLSACKADLNGTATEMESMMCYWYTTPCECEHSKQPDLLAVCLPSDIGENQRAELVVKGLTEQPELLSIHPELASNKIFYQHYPCE